MATRLFSVTLSLYNSNRDQYVLMQVRTLMLVVVVVVVLLLLLAVVAVVVVVVVVLLLLLLTLFLSLQMMFEIGPTGHWEK